VSLLFQAKRAYNETVEVKTRVLTVTTAVCLTGLVLLGLSDTDVSATDTKALDSETTSCVGEADNSSSAAAIMITMYAVADE